MATVIVAGTVSEQTGGKFANGAMTGAFIHMYNHLAVETTKAASGFHKRIVVYDSDGKRQYGVSFGVKPGESIFGGEGAVYEDYSDASTGITKFLQTTPAEDTRIIHYMQSQLGKTDSYYVIGNNCRNYSDSQFEYIKTNLGK